VLVLPGVHRLPVSTYQKIEQYALHGGIVIATRTLPSTAPGLMNAEKESQQIREISQRLFRATGAAGYFVEDESQLGTLMAGYVKPDVTLAPKTADIGFIHRQLSAGDLYFIANTSNQPRTAKAAFRQAARYAEWWDPFTGLVSSAGTADNIEVSLQPYESRLLFLTNSRMKPDSSPIVNSSSTNVHSTDIDLYTDWRLTFSGSNQNLHMDTLHSWSDEEPFKYYSGQVTYEKAFDLPKNLASNSSVILDFGEGTPIARPDPLPQFNMRAFLEGPLRDAAEIYVNGQRAGVVWHPPYTIDLSSLLKPGKNDLRIVVGNTAINSLAGRALPDYRILNDRYGERFVPQGMDNLQPLPSGILSGLRLRVTPRHPNMPRRAARPMN